MERGVEDWLAMARGRDWWVEIRNVRSIGRAVLGRLDVGVLRRRLVNYVEPRDAVAVRALSRKLTMLVFAVQAGRWSID